MIQIQFRYPAIPPLRISRVEDELLPTSGYFGTAYKLRPAKKKTEYNENFHENIVCAIEKLQFLLNATQSHRRDCHSMLKLEIKQRYGLGIELEASCEKCQYNTGPVSMTERTKNSDRGPKAFVINHSMSLACLKTKCGPSDIAFVLATLNIRPPSMTTIYTKLNQSAAETRNLNIEAMKQNQSISMAMSGDQGVDIETDTCYNNRPQQGYEAGTQAFSAIIDTRNNLTLECSIANKLCSKRKACMHENCNKNYRDEESIASSEQKLANRNLIKLEDNGIVSINSVTSDASSQLEKVVKEFSQRTGKKIVHYICLIHRMRCFYKAFKGLTFSSNYGPSMTKANFIAKLSIAVRKRAYREITRLRRDKFFVTKANKALLNITKCFQNDHKDCKKNSKACQQLEIPRFLPMGRYLEMDSNDILKIDGAIRKYFSTEKLVKIEKLLNTNKCEALHRRVTTYVPKCTTYPRNFENLCHSAILSKTYVAGKSTMMVTKRLVPSQHISSGPLCGFMENIDIRNKYFATRQKTDRYKKNRYFNRRKRESRKLLQNSVHASAEATKRGLHNYSLNPVVH